MPFKIQRIPRGLLEFLSINGPANPAELEDRVRATLDLTQFYGLTQRQQFVATNAAVAIGANLSMTLPVDKWCVLFAASISVSTTATLTQVGIGIALTRGPAAAQQPVSYGFQVVPASAGRATLNCFVPSYPLLLPPGSLVSGVVYLLLGDATCAAQAQCDVGVLG